jgi:hypothetical protein
MYIPCIIFGFNRPAILQQILQAIRPQKIDRLIVFIDGPRGERDISLVQECRKIVSSIDWVEKELHFHEINRGLSGILDDLDNAFEVYSSAVIIEDDCLPMPGFYSFMKLALEHYQSESRVFAVGGYQPLPRKRFRSDPYSLMSTWRFTCWGWATWQDRWMALKPYRLQFAELFNSLDNVPDIAGDDMANAARAVAQGRLATWDIQVSIAMLWLRQVMLLPTRGLIKNIGIYNGTHANNICDLFHNTNLYYSGNFSQDIKWIEDITPRKEYAQKMIELIKKIHHPSIMVRAIRKVLRSTSNLKKPDPVRYLNL